MTSRHNKLAGSPVCNWNANLVPRVSLPHIQLPGKGRKEGPWE